MPAKKKTKAQKMGERVVVPMTTAQRKALEEAAERAVLPVATWLRKVGLEAAAGR